MKRLKKNTQKGLYFLSIKYIYFKKPLIICSSALYTSCPYLLFVILYASLVINSVCIKAPNINILEMELLFINKLDISINTKNTYEKIS